MDDQQSERKIFGLNFGILADTLNDGLQEITVTFAITFHQRAGHSHCSPKVLGRLTDLEAVSP